MALLLIAVLAIIGAANAYPFCVPGRCFAKLYQYKTFQDFMPRPYEMGRTSFCIHVDDALRCIEDAKEEGDCSDGILQTIMLACMTATCNGERVFMGDALTDLNEMAKSPCASGLNYRQQFGEILAECNDTFTEYGPLEKHCGISVRGRMCLTDKINQECGPGYVSYFNRMWENLGMESCVTQRHILYELKRRSGSKLGNFGDIDFGSFGNFGGMAGFGNVGSLIPFGGSNQEDQE